MTWLEGIHKLWVLHSFTLNVLELFLCELGDCLFGSEHVGEVHLVKNYAIELSFQILVESGNTVLFLLSLLRCWHHLVEERWVAQEIVFNTLGIIIRKFFTIDGTVHNALLAHHPFHKRLKLSWRIFLRIVLDVEKLREFVFY